MAEGSGARHDGYGRLVARLQDMGFIVLNTTKKLVNDPSIRALDMKHPLLGSDISK